MVTLSPEGRYSASSERRKTATPPFGGRGLKEEEGGDVPKNKVPRSPALCQEAGSRRAWRVARLSEAVASVGKSRALREVRTLHEVRSSRCPRRTSRTRGCG